MGTNVLVHQWQLCDIRASVISQLPLGHGSALGYFTEAEWKMELRRPFSLSCKLEGLRAPEVFFIPPQNGGAGIPTNPG